MNRPIKFRAWDKRFNTMEEGGMYGPVVRFDGDIGMIETNQGSEETGEWTEWCSQSEDFVLMQFTGLHDKDGKEIWEGDVFLVDPESKTAKAQIVFKDGAFIKYYPHKDFTCPIDKIDLEIGKVIGNIFENPELLEVKNETE